jgi:type IV pilus assembly protein PilO
MSLKDDFVKLPWIGQLLIFIAIAIAIVVLGYYLIITDMEKQINSNNTQLSALQIDIQKGRESKARTEQFQQELKRIELQLEFLRKILPEKEELADLYTKIQERASHFGLQVTSFKPGAAVDREFFTEYPIDVAMNSEYHSLAKFFEEIGHLQRIVNISQIQLRGKTFKDKPEFTLEARIIASTYTYKESKE